MLSYQNLLERAQREAKKVIKKFSKKVNLIKKKNNEKSIKRSRPAWKIARNT